MATILAIIVQNDERQTDAATQYHRSTHQLLLQALLLDPFFKNPLLSTGSRIEKSTIFLISLWRTMHQKEED